MRDNDTGTRCTTRSEVRAGDNNDVSGCVACPVREALEANPHFLFELQRLIAEREAERQQWEVVTGSADVGRRQEA
jgi:hypothetical protein